MAKGTVLYVGNFELPDKGASANRVVSNAKLFNSIGYQTVMLGVSKDKTCTDIRPLKNDYGLMMYERPYPVSMKMWLGHMYSAEYIEKMIKLHEDTVLVILYNMPFSALKAAKKVCKGRNIKVAYDCTEWADVTDGNAVKRFVKKHDEKLIRNKLANAADGLIIISSMMERQYQGCKAMVKLPPLVDVEDKIWHQQPEPHEGYEFCFAGMLDGQKDSLDVIVKAFAKVCDEQTRLRIIGVTKDEFKSVYPDAAEELNKCGDNIIFMGMQSHFDTIRYVLGCDCYIFIRPSDTRNNAGFPTKFAEATTCGVPMIASKVSDVASFADKNATLIGSPNEGEIAEAMKIRSAKSEKNLVNKVFDYRNYQDRLSQWTTAILNGGGTDAGK
jgi:glycosyltransferase involved in cell wall biosynthesis